MFSSAQHFFEYEAGYPTGGFGNELSFDWPPVPLPPFHPSSSSLAGAITPPESHIYQPTSRLYERRLYFAQETARAPGHLPNLRHSASFSRDNTGSVLSAEEQREAQVHYVPKDVAFLTKGNSTVCYCDDVDNGVLNLKRSVTAICLGTTRLRSVLALLPTNKPS